MCARTRRGHRENVLGFIVSAQDAGSPVKCAKGSVVGCRRPADFKIEFVALDFAVRPAAADTFALAASLFTPLKQNW